MASNLTALDKIQTQIQWNRLLSVVEEQAQVLVRTADLVRTTPHLRVLIRQLGERADALRPRRRRRSRSRNLVLVGAIVHACRAAVRMVHS